MGLLCCKCTGIELRILLLFGYLYFVLFPLVSMCVAWEMDVRNGWILIFFAWLLGDLIRIIRCHLTNQDKNIWLKLGGMTRVD